MTSKTKQFKWSHNINKTFIDLGSHKGQSIEHFRQWKGIEFNDYQCFCFEPLIFTHKVYPNVTLIKYCAYTFNGSLKLYPSIGRRKLGSTIKIDSKNEVDKENPVNVPCLDIAEFINNLEGYIILKMNVEGAEYEIIPHMAVNNALNKINELFVAWHHLKIENFDEQIHTKCLKLIELYPNIKYKPLSDIQHNHPNMFTR